MILFYIDNEGDIVWFCKNTGLVWDVPEDYPYVSDFLQTLPAWPIQVVCQYLKDPSVSDSWLLQNIFQALSVFHNYAGQPST